MRKITVFILLVVFGVICDGSGVWAIDVGWMQPGVRVWYLGGVGSGSSSNAEEAYRFDAVDGANAQTTRHSALNHWQSPQPVETGTYPLAGMGPCWIHPLKLRTLEIGEYWMGLEITLVTRSTYATLLYQFLPARALLALNSQRELVKINYMIAGYLTGTAYFDAETGILLQYSRFNGYVMVFFVLSEINYNFEKQVPFAEDDGPHTGFKSFVSESSLGVLWVGGGTVTIQSLVETRYCSTVEMRTLTGISGPYGSMQADENYCFFGGVPIVRGMDATQAPNFQPDQWTPFGEYLWWWVPQPVLKKVTINIAGVPMAKTGAQPHTYTAMESPSRFFFTKIWFGDDGYMTAFSAKDTRIGLAIDPGDDVFRNLTAVNGLDYYRNTMGRATPISVNAGDVDGDYDVDLADAILASKILAGFGLAQDPGPEADVNGDSKVGAEELLCILQKISRLR